MVAALVQAVLAAAGPGTHCATVSEYAAGWGCGPDGLPPHVPALLESLLLTHAAKVREHQRERDAVARVPVGPGALATLAALALTRGVASPEAVDGGLPGGAPAPARTSASPFTSPAPRSRPPSALALLPFLTPAPLRALSCVLCVPRENLP